MAKILICRNCGEEFVVRPGKLGCIDQCVLCATDIPLLGGNMIWAHKTAPEIEIKSMVEAKAFAKKTRRFGAGVTCCLTQSQEMAHKSLTEHLTSGIGGLLNKKED